MPLDKKYYERYVAIFEERIKSIFADDMTKILEEFNFSNRGFFKLTYRYEPYNYKIVVENEFRTFDIIIFDADNASNVLKRIEHHNNSLSESNINKSISLLKNTLKKNDFNFYFSIDGRIYRKNRNGVKKIKNVKEILNG